METLDGNAIGDIGQPKAPASQLQFQRMAFCPTRRMALGGFAIEGIERTDYHVLLLSFRRMPISIIPETTGTATNPTESKGQGV